MKEDQQEVIYIYIYTDSGRFYKIQNKNLLINDTKIVHSAPFPNPLSNFIIYY